MKHAKWLAVSMLLLLGAGKSDDRSPAIPASQPTVKMIAPEAADIEYAPPFPIVAVRVDADQDTVALAQRLADFIGVKSLLRADQNPVCCIYVDVVRWMPNPGRHGYVINNEGGGSTVTASNTDELKKAVERFKSTSKMRDGKVTVPLAILTNYPIFP